MIRFVSRSLVMAALVSLTIPAAAQNIVGKDKTGPVPNPVNLDTTGMFQAKFVSVGDDMFIGGQPTEKAIRELKAKGVTTIVNLRMPEEMTRVGFDEAALAKELGIKYVHIPMRGTPENPYGPKQLDTFTEAMASADGKVLLHCTVAWRASHLWAAYLIRERKVPVATALAQTRQINLMDDMRMGDQQPLEGFLVRKVSKDHGMRGQVEGNLAGHRRIAVLDDVITSGESALIAAEAAETYKAEVVRVMAVVDRAQGATQIFQQKGFPFTSLFTIEELLPVERG